METTKVFLKNLIDNNLSESNIFKRNILKEYLQVLVLDYLYSHESYNKLIFYGGSCLKHCFDLPRLSEDLDFVDAKKEIKIKKLCKDLEEFFKKNTDLDLKTTCQKFRVYLKFPILQELELANKSESNFLFLKVEVFQNFNFCQKFKTQTIPLFKFNKSILVRSFDLETLMATKLRAILYRKWEKTNKQEEALIKVKGRDYFDLMWYLQKGIQPNIDCVEARDKQELKNKLLKIVSKIDSQSIKLDLEALIKDREFIKKLSGNIKEIITKQIKIAKW